MKNLPKLEFFLSVPIVWTLGIVPDFCQALCWLLQLSGTGSTGVGCRPEVPAGSPLGCGSVVWHITWGVGLAVHLAPVPVPGGPASAEGGSLARKGDLEQRNPCLRDLDFWNCWEGGQCGRVVVSLSVISALLCLPLNFWVTSEMLPELLGFALLYSSIKRDDICIYLIMFLWK